MPDFRVDLSVSLIGRNHGSLIQPGPQPHVHPRSWCFRHVVGVNLVTRLQPAFAGSARTGWLAGPSEGQQQNTSHCQLLGSCQRSHSRILCKHMCVEVYLPTCSCVSVCLSLSFSLYVRMYRGRYVRICASNCYVHIQGKTLMACHVEFFKVRSICSCCVRPWKDFLDCNMLSLQIVLSSVGFA